MKTYFSTAGAGPGDAIRDVLANLETRPAGQDLDLYVMAFSFTDAGIADALLGFVRRRARTRLRLIADWGQQRHAPSVVPKMITAAPPDGWFRYTRDNPYLWDRAAGRLRWSYHASRGFLHHKALIVVADGMPDTLVCGSANWTGKAARSHENTLVLTGSDPDEVVVVARFALEFAALWGNADYTLAPHDAAWVYDNLQRGAGDAWVGRFAPGAPLRPLRWCGRNAEDTARIAVAFSARSEAGVQRFGFCPANSDRRFRLTGRGGRTRTHPFSVTSLALALIFAARAGETLLLAMYGLSPRVAEYGALLDAARAGVWVRVLLDPKVGAATAARLRWQAESGGLPVEVRLARGTMHQKYLIHPESGSVATGTANMSTDSSLRHTEHRMLIRGSTEVAAAFITDFRRIWTDADGSGREGAPR